jgi:hypothetical protein
MPVFKWISVVVKILDLLTKFVDWLTKLANESAAKKAKDAIDESVKTGDQTPIEKAIGSENAGKPSNEKIDDLKTRPVGDHT